MEQIIPEATVPRKPALPEGEAGRINPVPLPTGGYNQGLQSILWPFLQEGSPEGQKGTRDRGEASLLGVSPEEEQ